MTTPTMETFKKESAFNLFTRLRHNDFPSKLIDGDLLGDKTVTVIDLSISDLVATNHFIFRICKLLLLKINEKEKEQTRTPLTSSGKEPEEEEVRKRDPSVLIFDEMRAFSVFKFSKFLTEEQKELLKNVEISTNYNHIGLLALYRDLRQHLALNHRLSLVVVYANSHVDQILNLFVNCPIKIAVILVFNKVMKRQINEFASKSSYQMIQCATPKVGLVEVKNETFKKTGIVKQVNGMMLLPDDDDDNDEEEGVGYSPTELMDFLS